VGIRDTKLYGQVEVKRQMHMHLSECERIGGDMDGGKTEPCGAVEDKGKLSHQLTGDRLVMDEPWERGRCRGLDSV